MWIIVVCCMVHDRCFFLLMRPLRQSQIFTSWITNFYPPTSQQTPPSRRSVWFERLWYYLGIKLPSWSNAQNQLRCALSWYFLKYWHNAHKFYWKSKDIIAQIHVSGIALYCNKFLNSVITSRSYIFYFFVNQSRTNMISVVIFFGLPFSIDATEGRFW
jgi:hypothetical protein